MLFFNVIENIFIKILLGEIWNAVKINRKKWKGNQKLVVSAHIVQQCQMQRWLVVSVRVIMSKPSLVFLITHALILSIGIWSENWYTGIKLVVLHLKRRFLCMRPLNFFQAHIWANMSMLIRLKGTDIWIKSSLLISFRKNQCALMRFSSAIRRIRRPGVGVGRGHGE